MSEAYSLVRMWTFAELLPRVPSFGYHIHAKNGEDPMHITLDKL
ncbi:hypothetical protein [Collinsella provencensis]|nr:hypothetical protein [Collinsella provencensis]